MIYIGTSGWSYEHWKKTFYPKELSHQEWLSYYSQFFSIVEVNSSFYRIPTDNAIKNWKAQTPFDFIFTLKASSYITHTKRLKDYTQSTRNFFKQAVKLKEKLGPILFQLPPSFSLNLPRFTDFIEHLPRDKRYVFEFRHSSWFNDEIYNLLQEHSIALCISDLNGVLTPTEVTTDFTYIRLHGPHIQYEGSYTNPQLQKWAQFIKKCEKKKITTYCFFDNDEKGYAVQDAFRLKDLIFT